MYRSAIKIILGLGLTLASAQSFATEHAIYGALGYTEGGIALGVDYENTKFGDFGVGGYARIYSKDKDNGADGVTTIGGFIRPHFNKKAWDMYLSPGFAIIKIDANNKPPGDATTLGPSLALGLMYELSSTVAIGVENMQHWVWFDEDHRGTKINDFMLRFRAAF